MRGFVSPFDDGEAQEAIRQAIAGDNTAELIGGIGGYQPEQSPVAPALPVSAPPVLEDMTPASYSAPEQAPMRRQRQAPAVGHVDPSLAFFAAFSQNPVLQKMVEESRNRPRLEAEAQRLAAGDQRARQKWEMERDIMSPLKAGKLQNENAMGAASLEAKQPSSATSKAMRQIGSEQLTAHASRLASAGLPGADQVQRMAQSIAQNESLSAEAVERMMRGVPGMTDKILSDARAAAADAERARHNVATEKIGQGRLSAEWAKLNARRETASNKAEITLRGPQEKLNKEINNLDVALQNMREIARLKGNVNTGIYASGLTDFMQKWISSDLTSEDRKQLNALVARTFNRETKELAGSAVSPAEWARIAPQIPEASDDDSLFVAKLAKAIEVTNAVLEARREEYQQKGGKPVDQSFTAAKNVKKVPQQAAPAQAQAPAANPQAEKMKAWLQPNPSDPRAEKVRAKLQAMGAL
jgi:hypothetical protein